MLQLQVANEKPGKSPVRLVCYQLNNNNIIPRFIYYKFIIMRQTCEYVLKCTCTANSSPAEHKV